MDLSGRLWPVMPCERAGFYWSQKHNSSSLSRSQAEGSHRETLGLLVGNMWHLGAWWHLSGSHISILSFQDCCPGLCSLQECASNTCIPGSLFCSHTSRFAFPSPTGSGHSQKRLFFFFCAFNISYRQMPGRGQDLME